MSLVWPVFGICLRAHISMRWKGFRLTSRAAGFNPPSALKFHPPVPLPPPREPQSSLGLVDLVGILLIAWGTTCPLAVLWIELCLSKAWFLRLVYVFYLVKRVALVLFLSLWQNIQNEKERDPFTCLKNPVASPRLRIVKMGTQIVTPTANQ